MIVQMVYEMSGGRYDDRAWPPTWTDFEVPDEEGEGLVACGAAVFVASSVVAPEPAKAAPPVVAVVPEPDPELAPEPAAVAEMSQPAPAEPKAVWVDYAVSRGAARREAEDSTKAQLQAAYGGRL